MNEQTVVTLLDEHVPFVSEKQHGSLLSGTTTVSFSEHQPQDPCRACLSDTPAC